jgi:hypothetical protein
MKPIRLVAVLGLGFVFGGSSTEVAIQANRAIRARAEHRSTRTGELVALEIRDEDSRLIARPRFIAAAGKPTELVLVDAERPSLVRLALRVETGREPSGEITLVWWLRLPGLDLTASGTTSLTPGVEQALDCGDLSAKVIALPVPSASFDAYVEAERLAGLRNSI